MLLSSRDEVRAFYEEAADGYNQMMDEEIKLPLYTEVLSGLAGRIRSVDGPVLDTSCGSGHMLEKLRDEYIHGRQLLGVDLSPKMVAIARARLGDAAAISEADMRNLSHLPDHLCAALISFFSLHHIDAGDLACCFAEWHRVLVPGGQLIVATWEGEGAIDYGNQADIFARRYTESELGEAVEGAGFQIDSRSVIPVEGFEMDALYIAATKNAP